MAIWPLRLRHFKEAEACGRSLIPETNEGGIAMAEEKTVDKDRETTQSEAQTTEQGQLEEKDLAKVAGGINSPRDVQSGLPV